MRRSSILSKNFGVSATLFERTLDPREIYIFKAPVPGPLGPDKLMDAEPAPQTFPVTAAFAYKKRAGRREYVRVTLARDNGTLAAQKYPKEMAHV